MNVILKLLSLGNLVSVWGPIAIELALKIKHLIELDPDMSVNVENLTGEAASADEETIKLIEEWKNKHGFGIIPNPS